MLKTFEDFVRLACRVYDLECDRAENYILRKLKEKGLSKLSVIYYINWADGDTLTQKEIAKKFNVTKRTVGYHLNRLRQVWPHLFNFGPRIPPLREMAYMPNENEQVNEIEIAKRF